jgi:hypothetical protein
MPWLAICLGVLLCGPPAAAAPFVIGTWYGTGQPHDKSEMWLDHLLPNGAFNGQYRSCVKGKAYDAAQSGNWSLAGDTLTIQIVTVNGLFNPRVDIYKNLFHDGKKWTYRFLGNGYVFNAERVEDSFKLFSCEAIS